MNSDETRTAPFNMALSTLEKLQKILVEIKKLSVMGEQHRKYFMVRQFHLQSMPLISKKDGATKMKTLKGNLRDIKLKRIRHFNRYSGEERLEEIFCSELDFQLDDIVEGIEDALQDEGYFMPPSEEEDLY